MSRTCEHCGEEITFRHIDGRVVPIHQHGHCVGQSLFSEESIRKAIPTKCPRCSESCFLVRHNGGSVWLDELGHPWPKHPCMIESEESAKERIVICVKPTLAPPPSALPVTKKTKVCPHCETTVRANRLRKHLRRCPKRVLAQNRSTLNRPVLIVEDVTGRKRALSNEDLCRFQMSEFSVRHDNTTEVLRGVALPELLRKLARPVGLQPDNAASLCLIAESATGRKVLFSWAEVDSLFSDRDGYIVPNDNDPDLSRFAAPRLVIPFDKNPSRWLNYVTHLKVQRI
jgi:hypothetical protein